MIEVHLDGSFHLSQPAFRVMKSQRYGRFVFIASSAGLFGQPQAAHYAAAKAGIVGLTNVIAIEGARARNPREQRAPVRLFADGHRDGRRGARRGAVAVPERARPEARGPDRRLPRQPRVRVHPSELLGRRGALRARLHRAREGLARRARQRADCRRHRRPSRRGLGDRALHRPVVDRRRGRRDLRAPRHHGVETATSWHGSACWPRRCRAALCRWRPASPASRRGPTAATVFVDADTSTRDQLEALAVQASLLAAGSLEPDVVRRLTRRPALARRYLAVEGHRALAANEHLLPLRVRSLIDGERRGSRRFAGRIAGCRAEPGGDRRPARQLRSHPRATSAGVRQPRRQPRRRRVSTFCASSETRCWSNSKRTRATTPTPP